MVVSGQQWASGLGQRVAALVVAGMVVVALLDYPTARVGLAVMLVGVAGIALRYPGAWLGALPLLLPIVNLAPWSGRYFFEEYDFLVWVAVAVSLWQGYYQPRRWVGLSLAAWLALGVFTLSYGLALARGLWPLDPLDENAFSSYYSHYNALRVARSWGLALVLLPPLLGLLAEDRDRAKRYFVGGMQLGLLGTGLIVLWERGVVYDLFNSPGLYGKLRNLLDFATPYRISAFFSEMHTGGEAIDGYLALAWPFALLGVFKSRSRVGTILAFAALGLGLYAAVVTFSRATYLAVGVGMVVMLIAVAGRVTARVPRWELLAGLVGIVGLGALALRGYRQGGYLALLGELFAVSAAIGLGYLAPRLDRRVWLSGMVAAPSLAVIAITHAQVSSKWGQVDGSTAVGYALMSTLVLAGFGGWLGSRVRGVVNVRGLCVAAVVVGLGMLVVVPSLFGSRMESRFSEVGSDFQTRYQHWSHALELMDPEPMTWLFGMGLGRFPGVYAYDWERDEGGTFRFVREPGNVVLRLSGGKDLRFGQRLGLAAWEDYVMSFDYRTEAPRAMLYVRVCRRHIVRPYEWNPDCRVFERTVASSQGAWTHIDWPFNIGALGDSVLPLGRQFLLVEISNRRVYDLLSEPPALVDFDNVEVLDNTGQNRLENGDFERGIDYWLPYYDFNHLPWHIKNVWVNVVFEQGGLGVLAFLGLVGYGLWRAWRYRWSEDGIPLVAWGAIWGFLAVGLVGTLMDVPRIMWLCFLVLFLVYGEGRERRRSRRSFRRAHGRME